MNLARRGLRMRRHRGMNRYQDRRKSQGYRTAAAQSSCAEPKTAESMFHNLKLDPRDMVKKLRSIKKRLYERHKPDTPHSATAEILVRTQNEGNKMPKIAAVVDKEKCVNCGICINVCPEEAISMNRDVAIDSSRCTACGSCVNVCPNEAISLSAMI